MVTRIAAAVLILFLGAGAADAAMCKAKERNTLFGEWFEPLVELNSKNSSGQVFHFVQGNVQGVRILIQWTAGRSTNWTLIVRDEHDQVLATLGPSDLEGEKDKQRWTGRLPVSKPYVQLDAPADSDVAIKISKGIAYATQASIQTYSAQNPDKPEWYDLYKSQTEIKRASAATGILLSAIYSPDGRKSWCCSGVMITKDVFMTNFHCGGIAGMRADDFWNPYICQNTVIDLGDQEQPNSKDQKPLSRQLNCVEVVGVDEDLDVAFLRVKPVAGVGGVVGQLPQVRWSKTSATDDLFVLHHAECKPKQVSQCKLSDADRNVPGKSNLIQHRCDTESGASGAPLLNANGELVGIHHSGFDRDENCKELDNVNKATKVEALLNFIEKITKHPEISSSIRYAPK